MYFVQINVQLSSEKIEAWPPSAAEHKIKKKFLSYYNHECAYEIGAEIHRKALRPFVMGAGEDTSGAIS